MQNKVFSTAKMMANRRTTDQQQRAIEAQGVSVVLSSGAGCGKTSVLTERYLKHLEDDGAEVSQLAAITFTERAAREMRERIRAAVVQRRAEGGDAAKRWNAHLRNLETANINTIHSFCGNILRQHALAAGLDPRFEILEEVLAARLRSESLRICLQRLLAKAGDSANGDLRQLVIDYGWYSTVEAIRNLIDSPKPDAWKTWLARSPAQIANAWLEARKALQAPFVDYLLATEGRIASFLELIRATPSSEPGTQANVSRILEAIPQLRDASELNALAEEINKCAQFGRLRAKAWNNDQSVYETIRDTSEDFRKVLKDKLAPLLDDDEKIEPAIRAGQRFIRVALEVVDEYQKRKRRAGYVDFDDLLTMARDLVRARDDVRRSLHERFRYILLDEMQDTDSVQMDLIRSLCTPSELKYGKLFAVGDHKQSIYRFRGAEVQLFHDLRTLVPEHGRLDLTRNFRSQAPILGFVNALCSLRLADYSPLEPNRPALHDAPCVEFLWSIPRNPDGKISAGDARRRDADSIAWRINQLLSDKIARVRDKETAQPRPVRLEDVVLLFRSMSNVAIYEEALRKQGLDYYLVGGRAFFAQQEIYDLYHLLRSLENPDDSLSLAGTLRSPFCCLSDETLFLLSLNHRGELWEGLHDEQVLGELPADQRDAVIRCRGNLKRWRSLKDRLPISRLIGAIFGDSGYDAAMQFEFLGDRKLANLWKLQEIARTFDRSGNFGLADFIDRLGEMVRDQPREEQAATLPEKANVVKLMSIHQAKGLEFPVVIIPDFAAATRSGNMSIAEWYPEFGCVAKPPSDVVPELFSRFGEKLSRISEAIADWAESLRVLYVACTRAEDLLILSAGFEEPLPEATAVTGSVPIKNANIWMRTLSERFNVRTGACISPDVTDKKSLRVAVQIIDGELTLVDAPRASPEKRGSKTISKPIELPKPSLPAVVLLPALERLLPDRPFGNIDPFKHLDGNNLEQFTNSILSEEERLLRRVLTGWNHRDVNDLPRAIAACSSKDASETDAVGRLKKWLRTFTGSDLYAAIQQADRVYGNLEFLVDPPDQSLPRGRGWIDLLAFAADGKSRIIAFHTDANETLKTAVKRRRPFIAIQAHAVREQTGIDCESAHLFDLASGKCTSIEISNGAEAWQTLKRLERAQTPATQTAYEVPKPS